MIRVPCRAQFRTFSLIVNIALRRIHRQATQPNPINNLLMLSLPLTIPEWPFFKKQNSVYYKYWNNNTDEIIDYADDLYKNQKYIEVYENLNRLKYMNNPEILWRIARALYKLSCTPDIPSSISNLMILEAVDVVNHALSVGNDNANVHKWTAIILDCKYNMEGIKAKINGLETIRYHITKAVELDETQTALYHMLGKLAYDLASLNWFQRKLANVLFEEPPSGSYEVAYDCFLKAEQSTPGFYVGNLVMLGKSAIKLGRLQQAKYFLQLASHYIPMTEEDKKLKLEAKTLSHTLDELNKDILPKAEDELQ